MRKTPRQQALALIAEHGAELTEWGDDRAELIGDIVTPTGRVWHTTGCHTLALNFHTDRPAGWRFIIEELSQGTEPCTDTGCEMCDRQP